MPKDLIDRRPPEDIAAVVLPVIGGAEVARSRLEESQGLAEALGVKLAFAVTILDDRDEFGFGGLTRDDEGIQYRKLASGEAVERACDLGGALSDVAGGSGDAICTGWT